MTTEAQTMDSGRTTMGFGIEEMTTASGFLGTACCRLGFKVQKIGFDFKDLPKRTKFLGLDVWELESRAQKKPARKGFIRTGDL